MSTNKQALLHAAVKIGAHTWEAEGSRVWSMSNGTADCLVLEVFGDETSGQQDCDIASFIAAANPATVIALLYELKESQDREANESDCADYTINLAINWQMRCKEAESKLVATEKRNTELTEFIQHVNKCLLKNGEYAPLSHELIQTVLGIRSDEKGAAK